MPEWWCQTLTGGSANAERVRLFISGGLAVRRNLRRRFTAGSTNQLVVSRRRKRGVIAALVVLLTLLTAKPALAGSATSAVGYYTVAGHQYLNYASVYGDTTNHFSDSTTFAGPYSGSSPAGWVGTRGRHFTSGGALSCEGTTTYNTSTLQSYQTWYSSSCTRSGVGTWYSYGVSAAWTGSAYQSVFTFKSPYQNS